jgi:hypothetical protein
MKAGKATSADTNTEKGINPSLTTNQRPEIFNEEVHSGAVPASVLTHRYWFAPVIEDPRNVSGRSMEEAPLRQSDFLAQTTPRQTRTRKAVVHSTGYLASKLLSSPGTYITPTFRPSSVAASSDDFRWLFHCELMFVEAAGFMRFH